MTPQEFARLEDYAEGIVRKLQLPPCPDILARIGRELGREHPDVHKIAFEASRDVASAATLLKTVNSPWYGLSSRARSVQQAITYLGLERTSLLMAGLMLRNVFPRSQRQAMARFWEASTQLAVTLAFFARVLHRPDRDEIHTFGLFRDAGSAVLINRFDDYDPVAIVANPEFGPSLTEAEQARFGTDHAVIGAVLARDWMLPREMCDAILWHHADFVLDMSERPIADGAVELIALGVLGDRTIERQRGAAADAAVDPTLAAALRTLRLDERQYAELDAEARSTLGGMDNQPQPTLRLTSLTLH
jgi:HD-like signal output (HDOD) protein